MSSAFERLSKKSKGVSDASTGGKQRLKIETMLEFADFSDGEYRTGRIYPGMFAMATHWFDVMSNDGKVVSIGKTCKRFDPVTQEFDSTKKCAVCENRDSLQATNYQKTEVGESRLDIKYFFNFLNRDKQADLPKKLRETPEELDAGFKSKQSTSLTPIEVVRCPAGLIEKFKKLQRAGKKETKLDDPEKGRDVSISFNKDEKVAANMWDAQKADEPGEPLSNKEKDYLIWDIPTAIKKMQDSTTYEEDMKDVEKAMADFGGKKSKDKSKKAKGKAKDEDEEDEKPAGKSKDKSAKGGKSKAPVEDEDSGKKSKDKSKDKKKSKDEDEEDEKPAKGGKGGKEEKSKDKKKSKEEEKPAEKSKDKSKDKKKSKDEDEEEKPAEKSKDKKKSKEDEKPAKGGKDKKGASKFDIDDDEEDAKPAKDKKKKK